MNLLETPYAVSLKTANTEDGKLLQVVKTKYESSRKAVLRQLADLDKAKIESAYQLKMLKFNRSNELSTINEDLTSLEEGLANLKQLDSPEQAMQMLSKVTTSKEQLAKTATEKAEQYKKQAAEFKKQLSNVQATTDIAVRWHNENFSEDLTASEVEEVTED